MLFFKNSREQLQAGRMKRYAYTKESGAQGRKRRKAELEASVTSGNVLRNFLGLPPLTKETSTAESAMADESKVAKDQSTSVSGSLDPSVVMKTSRRPHAICSQTPLREPAEENLPEKASSFANFRNTHNQWRESQALGQ